ncbi:MAG: hypothetical protein ABIK09_04365, partial [Pseudomonadota bacterium]
MISTAHITLLLTLALGAEAPDHAGVGVFLPGQEAAVVDLLAPDDLDSFRCGDWTLDALVPGPDCALRFHMSGPDGATRTVRISPDGPAEAKGPDAVKACVEARVRSNAGGDFFDGRCTLPSEAVRVEIRGVGGRLRLALLGLAALLALGLLFWRVGAEAPPTARIARRRSPVGGAS